MNLDVNIQRLLRRYLLRNFQTIKIKHNKRFKRAIIINSKVYFKSGSNNTSLINEICKITAVVFGYELNIIKPFVIDIISN